MGVIGSIARPIVDDAVEIVFWNASSGTPFVDEISRQRMGRQLARSQAARSLIAASGIPVLTRWRAPWPS